MTEFEWLEIGYEKGIIDTMNGMYITFQKAYGDWFMMKYSDSWTMTYNYMRDGLDYGA